MSDETRVCNVCGRAPYALWLGGRCQWCVAGWLAPRSSTTGTPAPTCCDAEYEVATAIGKVPCPSHFAEFLAKRTGVAPPSRDASKPVPVSFRECGDREPHRTFNASAPRGSCPFGWCGDGSKGCRRAECIAHAALPEDAPTPAWPALCAHCGVKRCQHFGRAEYCTNDGFEAQSGPTYTPGAADPDEHAPAPGYTPPDAEDAPTPRERMKDAWADLEQVYLDGGPSSAWVPAAIALWKEIDAALVVEDKHALSVGRSLLAALETVPRGALTIDMWVSADETKVFLLSGDTENVENDEARALAALLTVKR